MGVYERAFEVSHSFGQPEEDHTVDSVVQWLSGSKVSLRKDETTPCLALSLSDEATPHRHAPGAEPSARRALR